MYIEAGVACDARHGSHSFLNSGGIAHRIAEQPFCAASCPPKSCPHRPPPSPNNRRAGYVRRYQHIMNVMDWLFSNPSKYLPDTDVLVNLASLLCAIWLLLRIIAFVK